MPCASLLLVDFPVYFLSQKDWLMNYYKIRQKSFPTIQEPWQIENFWLRFPNQISIIPFRLESDRVESHIRHLYTYRVECVPIFGMGEIYVEPKSQSARTNVINLNKIADPGSHPFPPVAQSGRKPEMCINICLIMFPLHHWSGHSFECAWFYVGWRKALKAYVSLVSKWVLIWVAQSRWVFPNNVRRMLIGSIETGKDKVVGLGNSPCQCFANYDN